MALKWNFQRGWEVQAKKPSVGGVWIFSGTTQYIPTFARYILNIVDNVHSQENATRNLNRNYHTTQGYMYMIIIHLKNRNCVLCLSSYTCRNTSGSLRERQILWKHKPREKCFHSFFEFS